MTPEELSNQLTSLNSKAQLREDTSPIGVSIERESLHQYLSDLKTKAHFDFLLSHSAIDWIEENEFELVYVLFSTKYNLKAIVTSRIPRAEGIAPSVMDIWATAEWQERESFDLMGIKYDNHKDLRRLFLDDDWEGYPLRKDYQDDFLLERPKK